MGEQRPSALAWTSWHHQLHNRLRQQPQLLPAGARLLLAISGGQDSMALLGLLQELQPQHHWTLLLWHDRSGQALHVFRVLLRHFRGNLHDG